MLSTMSGQRGMIQSSGKVSTLLSRRFWQTNLLPQLVKSFFLSYELLKRSFFPLQTPMCATRSISVSLTSDHRVDPSLILIQIIVTSRTAHQFILQNLCSPPPGWAVKKRRRLSWRTRRAQCRAIDITHVDRMPVIQLISLYPHYACLVLLPGE